MKRIISALICLLVACNFTMAQGNGIVVHKDSRIDVLLKKQGDINKVASFKASNGQYKGYRVMVLNSNDKEYAYRIKGQLLSRFPEQTTYMSYQAPFYKLLFGDFLKKSDGEDYRKQISSIVSKGVFLIPTVIRLKPEDEQRLMKELEAGR